MKIERGGQGFNIDMGGILEVLLLNSVTQSNMLTIILNKQLELEQLIGGKDLDDHETQDAVKEEITRLTDLIADMSTNKKNSILADLYLKQSD